jgi:hypothetical protein
MSLLPAVIRAFFIFRGSLLRVRWQSAGAFAWALAQPSKKLAKFSPAGKAAAAAVADQLRNVSPSLAMAQQA